MRAVIVVAQLLLALLLSACGGPFYFPRSYAPDKESYPEFAEIVIVSRSPIQKGQTPQLRGTIVDWDGEPIIGATIQVRGAQTDELVEANTDVWGNFRLDTPSFEQPFQIQIAALGCRDVIVKETYVSSEEAVDLRVILSLSEGPSYATGGPSMLEWRHTSTGATIKADERTGEPVVHRP